MRVWILAALTLLSACTTNVDLGMQPRNLEFTERIRTNYARIRPMLLAGRIDEADAALKALSTPEELVTRSLLAVDEAIDGRVAATAASSRSAVRMATG